MSRLLTTSTLTAVPLAPPATPSPWAIDPARTQQLPPSGATSPAVQPRDIFVTNGDGTPYSGTPTVQLRQQGGAFYSADPANVLSLGDGWFRVNLQDSDVATPGFLVAVATAPSTPDGYAAWWVGEGNTPVAGYTWYSLPFFMMSTATRNGITGLAPSVQICPPGQSAMQTPAGTVQEVGLGVYELLPAVSDVEDAGVLPFHASGDGALDYYDEFTIDYAGD